MIENRNLHTEVNRRIAVGYKNSNVTTDRGGCLEPRLTLHGEGDRREAGITGVTR